MARRLAPPSSLLQGTIIQALDTGRRQWLDATVQGTSPAGTCLRVSFVDAGRSVLVRRRGGGSGTRGQERRMVGGSSVGVAGLHPEAGLLSAVCNRACVLPGKDVQ